MEPKHLTETEFNELVSTFSKGDKQWKFLGKRPAIIDFYASWCGPCRALAPVLDELATEYAGKIDIYKVDTDAQQRLAARFDIRSIPTLLFIPMEGKPHIARGVQPKDKLRKVVEEVLLHKVS